MQESIAKIQMYVIQYGMNVLAALVILIVGKWLARFVSRVVEGTMVRSKVNSTLAGFAKNITYFAALTFVVVAALNKLGVETNSFIAIIGAAGLAVGLALQGSLSNFAAGVMMIVFRPFELGDTIEAGGAAGVVREIQIFNTILHTPDNKKVIVPNAKITGDKIIVHPKA